MSNLVEKYINPALEQEILAMEFPNKPRTPKQRYFLTDKGILILHSLEDEKEQEG